MVYGELVRDSALYELKFYHLFYQTARPHDPTGVSDSTGI